ncbi:MAG: thiamine pyrophosphate-dependent dehydrogenase E1 component subunit alpha [Spirochaetaceae bacterium]|jgi:pyruvate dehydrogenase E1 component alpha subunit|nr:thiamine pyrophosphate-dependent dehydrogenase E1 component subunit alpha [Spirochaetaceae bacterium]
MQFTKEQQLHLYEELVFARAFGEKVVEYIFAGRMNGSVHPTLGQEAVDAGIWIARELSPVTVYIQCTHRQQPLLARIVGLDPTLGDCMHRRIGALSGLSGEFHEVSMKDRLLPSSGILGEGPLSSTGYAWTVKQRKQAGTAVVSCFGDGAMSEGAVYEGMNLAGILKLPILYVIENNQVAMTTPFSEEAPIADLAIRAAGAGMKGVTVDGNDIEAVIEAVLAGTRMAAANEPNLVELKTWRWQGHHVGEKQEKYRDTDFLKNTDPLDPVKRYEKTLLQRGTAGEAHFAKVRDEQYALIDQAFDRVFQSQAPARDMALDYNLMYSNNAGGAL